MNNFSAKATEALNAAMRAAGELGHGYIGTEHLLLGLAQTSDSIAQKILSQNGITSEYIVSKISEMIGTGTPSFVSGQDMTPRLKKILEQSFSEARQTGHNVIGTEHLLMALLRERDSKGVEIIEAQACPGHIHMLLSIPLKYSVSQIMGYRKGKSSLMIFDRHANLKYKYGDRNFLTRGYYVDTVGRNKKQIQEYIKHQREEDQIADQMSLKEFVDPFTGSKNSKA